jgi:hypothetical protein
MTHSQIPTGPAFCSTSSYVAKMPTATVNERERDREYLEGAERRLQLLRVARGLDGTFAGLCATRFFNCHPNHLAFIGEVCEP